MGNRGWDGNKGIGMIESRVVVNDEAEQITEIEKTM